MNTKNEKNICRRILVMHSRAITQLVAIRDRKHCRKFSNMAAVISRARHDGAVCQKGIPA